MDKARARIHQLSALVERHSAQIAQHEATLNRVVYTLFDLTPDEITLIENGEAG